MTDQEIAGIIKFLGVVAGAVTAYITTTIQVRKHLDKRVAENSAGVTAIAELIRKDKELQDHAERIEQSVEKRDKERGEEIRALAKEIRDFTFQALSLFNINQKK